MAQNGTWDLDRCEILFSVSTIFGCSERKASEEGQKRYVCPFFVKALGISWLYSPGDPAALCNAYVSSSVRVCACVCVCWCMCVCGRRWSFE